MHLQKTANQMEAPAKGLNCNLCQVPPPPAGGGRVFRRLGVGLRPGLVSRRPVCGWGRMQLRFRPTGAHASAPANGRQVADVSQLPGAGGETEMRFPRERDSLEVRPFAGTRARLGTFTVPTPAHNSTPPQATPAGEPSPADSIGNVSAHQGEVGAALKLPSLKLPAMLTTML